MAKVLEDFIAGNNASHQESDDQDCDTTQNGHGDGMGMQTLIDA